MPVYQLPSDPKLFPKPELAEPNGLIAVGGDLSTERLINAYLLGFFPWFSDGDEIMWWHPKDRMVLFPCDLKLSKSMRPYFNQKKYRCTINQNFPEVIAACSNINREDQEGTWILDSMIKAYSELHQLGFAHSVEVWEGKSLVGGLYGLSLGKIFYGESMFSERKNASKFGLIFWVNQLESKGFKLIDCQQETAHLRSMGADIISQKEFIRHLEMNHAEIAKAGELKTEFIMPN